MFKKVSICYRIVISAAPQYVNKGNDNSVPEVNVCRSIGNKSKTVLIYKIIKCTG